MDKYLGDSLMATFGMPSSSGRDAVNALACVCAMQVARERWNKERVAAGEEALRVGFGLHYGPVVLGDIGANRLEFAMIGNTVNIASHLESLTRPLSVALVASDALVQAGNEQASEGSLLASLERRSEEAIRGLSELICLRTLAR